MRLTSPTSTQGGSLSNLSLENEVAWKLIKLWPADFSVISGNHLDIEQTLNNYN